MINTKTKDLTWQGNVLYYGRRKLSEIRRDPDWPRIWRVVEADGSLSDMVNISRAKDAAMARASRILETRGGLRGRPEDRAE